VSIFVEQVMLVDVHPQNIQPIISLPHVEHLARKVSKIGVFLEHGIEFVIGLLPS
jgi:hypothetical protein